MGRISLLSRSADRRRTHRVAAVDQSAGRHLRPGGHRRGVLRLSLANRDLFQSAQVRLQSGEAATGDGGSPQAVLDAVHDRGLACAVCHDARPRLPRNALHRSVRRRGVESGVGDRETQAHAEHACAVGRIPEAGGGPRRSPRSQARRRARSANHVDRLAAHRRFRHCLADLWP